MTDILAWHFVGKTLRDGRPIPSDGEWLEQSGEIIPCKSGLHGSVRLIDALEYAPSATLCRVTLAGTIVPHNGDKHAASRRIIHWRIDASDLLRTFARRCALDVIHLWAAPEIVRQYLETGNETLRDAAEAAIRDAAMAAATGAPRAAARAAAEAVIRDAAGNAWAAARNAAWAAATGATWAAATDAAWVAATDAQNDILTVMVHAIAQNRGYEMEPAIRDMDN